MRISEKLLKNHTGGEDDVPTFSFEFFVPKTSQGVQNLYDRMDRMYDLAPQFIDITWNAGGRLSTLTNEMVATAQSVLGLETCMHLTCTNMPVELIDKALKSAYNAGCQNILALRGDPPIEGGEWTAVEGGFTYAKDLVKYIREKYGDHFDIGVAGYPEGHPEEDSDEKCIEYLKEKVDCGANFIITQMFYDADNFINWCAKLRAFGIDIPIIPGIMPISQYASFKRRATWSEIAIPPHFEERLEPVKDDDQLVRQVGTELVSEMCLKILKSGYVNHLHLYTMNLEKSSVMILENLGLIQLNKEKHSSDVAELPWRRSLNPTRSEEAVRPIFWKNRKYSYITRTQNWDEFPNGRWGDSNSPAFGDFDSFTAGLLRQSPKRCIELWGTPTSLEQLGDLIVNYLTNTIKALPWSDTPVTEEIDSIKESLVALNKKNIFTINSQPSVNGASSADSKVGWGPKNGYVYQKEYLEFLLPKEKLSQLIEQLGQFPSLAYLAIDKTSELVTNHIDNSATAVTWGIFPGREVLQPTIVEANSFLAWKDEVYRILEEWSSVFAHSEKPESAQLIKNVSENYALVTVVDNDFVGQEKIFNILNQL